MTNKPLCYIPKNGIEHYWYKDLYFCINDTGNTLDGKPYAIIYSRNDENSNDLFWYVKYHELDKMKEIDLEFLKSKLNRAIDIVSQDI